MTGAHLHRHFSSFAVYAGQAPESRGLTTTRFDKRVLLLAFGAAEALGMQFVVADFRYDDRTTARTLVRDTISGRENA